MFISTKCLVAASFLASLGAASSAAAGDVRLNGNGEPTMEVAYADLNLDHADGQRKLQARIKRAAKMVCGHITGRVSLKETLAVASCVDGATQKAMLAFNGRGNVQVAGRMDDGAGASR